MNEAKTKQVPAEALCCVVGHFELGDNGDDSKSAPFRMVARSGDSIEHWYWGKVVHDLSGMRLPARQRVAIDYAHDVDQIIGYANDFSTEDGDLRANGALTPYGSNDRATEIIHKSKQGVPYEASINFGGDGIVIEEYSEGEDVAVNGRNFAGPVTIIREWPLRGIAVCPYGADANTSTEFANSQKTEVTIMAHEEMKTEQETGEALQAVDSETDLDNTDEAVEAVETVAEELVAEAPSTMTGPDFLAAFGDQGGVWFAEGRSYEESQTLYVEAIKVENEELKQKLSVRDSAAGEDEPIDFSSDEDDNAKSKGFAGRIRIK